MKDYTEMSDALEELLYNQKLPRKLKKALKHIEIVDVCVGFNYEGGDITEYRYATKDGYLQTKWVNKIISKLN